MEGETDSIILLDTVLQNILSDTVQHRILIFVGHCLAESILLDTVLQRIFCWTLSCTEYFVGHYPAENICRTLSGRIFCWILSCIEY